MDKHIKYYNRKRLTVKNPDKKTYRATVKDKELIKELETKLLKSYTGPLIDRLGAYEDTGLEPEEIEKLKKNRGK